MSEINPYQQPQADLVDAGNTAAQSLTILSEPRKVSVGEALGWIGRGHKMLPGHWGVVLGALVVTVLITSAFQIIPLLGMIAQVLATPLLYAGIVKIFHRMETEGTSDFGDLFAGFSERTGPLILMALAQIGVMLLLGLVFGGLGYALGAGGSSNTAAMAVLGLLGVVAMFVFVYTFYFAVPLIFLGNKGVGEAMKLSLGAFTRNVIPFIVYLLVTMVIMLVAALPLLLGWLFVMPILAGAYYVSFRQIFVE
ncbi:MAG: BPSS1780 family membrane protein [Pseudomonadota bacterium]|nr:BPSS1780 family membrane protein [Pseudomonadota bacterium]